MTNFNETKLAEVVEAAKAKVAGNKRWTNAVTNAATLLASGNPYIHFTGHSLLVLSDSNEIYEANGVCQCKAFEQGQPCRHRAAYKLVKNYLDAH